MATVHLVKDGVTRQGTSLTRSFEVTIEDAQAELGHRSTRYSEGVPRINPDKAANDIAEYRHVVLKVHDGEQGGAFPKPGYYLLPDLSPRDCQSLFKDSGSLV